MKDSDIEEPTEDQKIFYLANNPGDIEQKRDWNENNRMLDEKYNGNNNSIQKEKDNNKHNVDMYELESLIPNKDYAEFAIQRIKKTVKMEDILVRQVFYTGLSMYSFDPINLGILAPTSEGKTYVVTQVLKYFPTQDVWNIGSMSTKVLVRQRGVLVDSNNDPLEPRIADLKRLIDKQKDTEEKTRLKDQLKSLIENTKRLIDLSCKVVVFLEEPQAELWNLLKPILSHDLPEIEFPYVDKTEREGIITKRVVVRGWPACIFCSAKDESGWKIWPEIQSRFLITSPSMNKEKYFESNLLIAQRKGLPNIVQQQIIISDKEIDLARKCVILLKLQIKNFYNSNNAHYDKNTSAVWIPYYGFLGEALESNKGSDNRVANRIFSLLNIIPLTMCKTSARSSKVATTRFSFP